MNDKLKVWEFDKPDVGRLFLVYTLYEDEPVVCKMNDDGPEHLMTGLVPDSTPYCGGSSESVLDICKFARWRYVPAAPDWGQVVRVG